MIDRWRWAAYQGWPDAAAILFSQVYVFVQRLHRGHPIPFRVEAHHCKAEIGFTIGNNFLNAAHIRHPCVRTPVYVLRGCGDMCVLAHDERERERERRGGEEGCTHYLENGVP